MALRSIREVERRDKAHARGIDHERAWDTRILANFHIACEVAHINIELAVGGMVWIKAQPQKALLACRADLTGKIEEGSGLQLARHGIEHADLPGLLDNEEVLVVSWGRSGKERLRQARGKARCRDGNLLARSVRIISVDAIACVRSLQMVCSIRPFDHECRHHGQPPVANHCYIYIPIDTLCYFGYTI
jgi:hypothetical protein